MSENSPFKPVPAAPAPAAVPAPTPMAAPEPAPVTQQKLFEETEVKPDELKLLKQRADIMGVRYSNNIGVEALAAKIKAAMSEEVAAENSRVTEPRSEEKSTEALAPQVAEERQRTPQELKQAKRLELQKEHMKLVRLRITNLDPKKADLKGEVLTVANRFLGKVSKFVPYGDACGEDGYHVPHFLYLMMKDRKFSQVKTDAQGRPYARDVSEFALEVLPPLTQKDIDRLALKQAAARGAVEAD